MKQGLIAAVSASHVMLIQHAVMALKTKTRMELTVEGYVMIVQTADLMILNYTISRKKMLRLILKRHPGPVR